VKLNVLKTSCNTLKTVVKYPGDPREVERLRGRAAVERRSKWLDAHPLCCMCEAEGVVKAGDVVDHIQPLWDGGQDDESNLQTLCQTPHHDEKTAKEAGIRAKRK
jgi:5-methylcytosine-specific restriction protein A